MVYITNEKINEIISQASIVDIISSYLHLIKKGNNYLAICPFHNDSNPSLTISPQKRIYTCFSCKATGNVINFIKDYEHVDFLTALKTVCEKSNIQLDELKDFHQPIKDLESEIILKLNSEANDIFKTTLFSNLGSNALEYLKSRNISIEEIKKFEIGFASDKTNLVQKLLDKNYNSLDIEKANLGIITNSYNKDYFINRIIFPIKDENNHIIGFSGRSYTKDNEPKYLNTKENKVFKKSHLAYNIASALKISKSLKQIIVLEGFMDVISLSRIDINNTIALMGTSLSNYHLELFKKHNLEVLLFLDGDDPGVQANIKISHQLLKQQINVKIIDNQTSYDPDELINNDLEYLKQIINKPIHPINCLIEKKWLKTDINDPNQIEDFIKNVLSFIVDLNNNILIENTIKKLCELTKISEQTIKKTLDELKTKLNKQQFNKNIIKKPYTTNKPISKKNPVDFIKKEYINAEQRIFVSLLISDQFLDKIAANVEKMIHPDIKYATINLINLYNKKIYQGNDINKAFELLKEYNLTGFDKKQEEIINNSLITQITIKESEIDDAFNKLDLYHKHAEVLNLKKMLVESKNKTERIQIWNGIDTLKNKKKKR
ncbi:DNA primase [Mycoplasma capricolum]|uniref:DNA primase n=1 Tax=Mycoplasma capricolum subsp. capripneumoniae 87001 TaxID=1124992 RepID=A0A9N7G7D6_MYCCC|nr:DNA primase [Mycoplasma capricolum]AJK51542.1 DNA primase [Mycoplasma capricolum subsp. capripneumoniae 87001]AOQ22202.1 DNA primase [Mycoplasma capricolum subsp. capripneumoniae M1601]AQU77562.1 DNA primase [Mycoplasma capricolum subsp. capripneumoniae]QIN42445.1 DNA primase [Mycoplasma capricolum subsp. capripneumoniae]QIN43145.1 DNA primase [Mycoplasma capricolum subsp. capripneumoniae]